MKRPKPRDYGLDSDHPTLNGVSAYNLPADPAQPFTQEELDAALDTLVRAQAVTVRQARYAEAVEEFNWNNGGR